MGPRNSKQSQDNFTKDYEIIQSNTEENIKFLIHKKSEQEFLLKEFNFNEKAQCEKTMDKLAQLKNKLAGNKHVVPLKDYFMYTQDQYCSTFYKIYALFEYPQRTLDDQIAQRKLHRKRFTETELWSILASCIVGMSHLQKNGIKHGALRSNRILLSTQGIIKVCDPYAMGQHSNYDNSLTKRSPPHAYLSPEQTQSLQMQLITPTYNSFKSDIFTLGMIILQAGLFEYQDQQCYRDDKTRIHWETVQYNIDRMGQAYSNQIKNMVEIMLSRDERARPDWMDLESHVMKGGDQVRASFVNGDGASFVTSEKNLSSMGNVNSGTGGFNASNISNNNNTNVNTNKLVGVSQGDPTRNLGTSNAIRNNQPPIRVGPVQQQPPPQQLFQQQTPRQQPPTIYSPPPVQNNNYPRPISPSPLVTPVLITPPPSNFFSFSQFPNPSPSQIGQPFTVNNNNYPSTSTSGSMPPLKPSVIDLTRPLRNVFPKDTYETKTRFDQNLIVMTQDDDTMSESDNAHLNMQNNQQQSGNQQQQKYWTGGNNNISNNNTSNNNIGNVQYSRPPPSQTVQNQFSNHNTNVSINPNTNTYNNNNNNNRALTNYQSAGNNQNVYRNTQSTQPKQQYNPQQQPQQQQQPIFVSELFKMGSRYQGYKLNGLRHGLGKFYYQDGGMYDGEWRMNKMQGRGKLYYQSGKLAYDGQWENDKFRGHGILYNQFPEQINQGFDYNNFQNADEYWVEYQGEFLDDLRHGKGVLYLSNGQKFEGTFQADVIEGPGKFYRQNGEVIEGLWANNLKI